MQCNLLKLLAIQYSFIPLKLATQVTPHQWCEVLCLAAMSLASEAVTRTHLAKNHAFVLLRPDVSSSSAAAPSVQHSSYKTHQVWSLK